MKKILLMAAILLSVLSNAQENTTIGINAGATYSNIQDNGDPSDYAFDFLVGLSLEVPLGNNFALLTNVNYERKTSQESVLDPSGLYYVNLKARFHYLTIPVNAKYYFGEKKMFFVHAGPYAGIFIDDTFLIGNKKATGEYTGTSDFKLLDFGITSGFGVRIPVNDNNSITLGLRSNLGLSNVSDMPEYKIKTNSFNFVLTWENIL